MDTDNISQTKSNDSNESTNAADTTENTEQKNVIDIIGNGQLVKTVCLASHFRQLTLPQQFPKHFRINRIACAWTL